MACYRLGILDQFASVAAWLVDMKAAIAFSPASRLMALCVLALLECYPYLGSKKSPFHASTPLTLTSQCRYSSPSKRMMTSICLTGLYSSQAHFCFAALPFPTSGVEQHFPCKRVNLEVSIVVVVDWLALPAELMVLQVFGNLGKVSRIPSTSRLAESTHSLGDGTLLRPSFRG